MCAHHRFPLSAIAAVTQSFQEQRRLFEARNEHHARAVHTFCWSCVLKENSSSSRFYNVLCMSVCVTFLKPPGVGGATKLFAVRKTAPDLINKRPLQCVYTVHVSHP